MTTLFLPSNIFTRAGSVTCKSLLYAANWWDWWIFVASLANQTLSACRMENSRLSNLGGSSWRWGRTGTFKSRCWNIGQSWWWAFFGCTIKTLKPYSASSTSRRTSPTSFTTSLKLSCPFCNTTATYCRMSTSCSCPRAPATFTWMPFRY